MKLCNERIGDAERAATLAINVLKAAVYPQETGNPYLMFAGISMDIPVPEVFGGGTVTINSLPENDGLPEKNFLQKNQGHIEERVIPLARQVFAYAQKHGIDSVLKLFDQPPIRHVLETGLAEPYVPTERDLRSVIVDSDVKPVSRREAIGTGAQVVVASVVKLFPPPQVQ